MNFIQKNPQDPKYGEFHDGEYEYWPIDTSVKSKSISFPAAVMSGLELIAAAAAAGLLAMTMAALYVMSSPLSLGENGAAINANVYNNRDGQSIVYTLSAAADPDYVLQDGILEDDKSTLMLTDLTAGTTYLLRYYNADQEEIGDFWFTTSGEPDTLPPAEIPDVPPQIPSETKTAEETTEETVEETVAETTEATTEPVTEPTEPPRLPVYYPPAPKPPAVKPTEPEEVKPGTEPTEPEEATDPTESEEEETKPGTEPTVPPEPEILVVEADMGEVKHVPPEISGDEVKAYFQFEEYHTFLNVPQNGYTIKIDQGGTEITEYDTDWSEADGTLRISFEGRPIPIGKATKTTVTLTIGSKSYTSTNTVFPPTLKNVDITVEKNEDGTHTFTAIANVTSDGTQEMTCEAHIYTTQTDDTGVFLTMTEESPGRYTADYTTEVETEQNPEWARTEIKAYWARTNPGDFAESDYEYCEYTP